VTPSLTDIKRELDRIGRRARWEPQLDNVLGWAGVIWILLFLIYGLFPPMQHIRGWPGVALAFSLGYCAWFYYRAGKRNQPPKHDWGSRDSIPVRPNIPLTSQPSASAAQALPAEEETAEA